MLDKQTLVGMENVNVILESEMFEYMGLDYVFIVDEY